MTKLWRYVWCARPRFHRGVLLWWKRRNETAEQTAERDANTRRVFRDIWNQHKRDVWDQTPETREVMELRAELDQLMDEVLGKEFPEDVHSGGNLHPIE